MDRKCKHHNVNYAYEDLVDVEKVKVIATCMGCRATGRATVDYDTPGDEMRTAALQIIVGLDTPVMRYQSDTHDELYFHIHEGRASLSTQQFKPLIINSSTDDKRYVGATVIFRREKNLEGPWSYAVARCSIADNFNRTVGRKVARRRLMADIHAGRCGFVDVPRPDYQLARDLYIEGS